MPGVRRPHRSTRSRRRQPARSTRAARLGLRRPARTSPLPGRVTQGRKKLDLTQLLTLGAVLVSLVFAIPQAINAQATLESTRSQNDTDRQGQLTDRFSKAVEQLGTPENLEVRLGGIYALERIAGDSERDHPAVMNVLSAFVRETSKKLRSPQGPCPNTPPAPDVQAALAVLVDRDPEWDRDQIDLAGACLNDTDLVDTDLAGAYLNGVDFHGANFTRSDLTAADLIGADLAGADFHGANLNSAELIDADLVGAHLDEADFPHTHLNGANLRGADLYDIILDSAVLTGADLAHADLDAASFSDADLRGAHGLTPQQFYTAGSLEGVMGLPPSWSQRPR